MEAEEVVVGLVRSAHGLTGELLVEEKTADPEEVFSEGRVFRVEGGGSGQVEARLTLQSSRPHRGGRLVRFVEVVDRTGAERYAGRHLAVDRDELRPLAEDEYFVQELVGFEAVGQLEESIGLVRSVYETAGSTILGIDADGREVLVPFQAMFVTRVSRAERKIWIDGPEGLLEL